MTPDDPIAQLLEVTEAYVGGLLAALHEALDHWESWDAEYPDLINGYRGALASRIAELRAKYPRVTP